MPKVSVILSSYNHEAYVAQAIESVLNQTFKDFELLIYDDGSSDKSADIIRSFHDDRIKMFLYPKNRGPLEASKEPARVACGEYIAIHHSDDMWAPDKLEKQVKFLDEHKSYAACFTLVKFIDEKGEDYIPDEGSFYRTVFQQENRTRAAWLHQFFFYGNCLCHPSLLIRREKYEQYDLLNIEGLCQLPDYYMWVKLALHENIYVYQEQLTKFRLRNNVEQSQQSGERPEVSIRSQFELYQVLQLYKTIDQRRFMLEVFPESAEYLEDEGDLLFALAKMAQRIDSPPYQMLALDILYDAVRDPKRSKEIERKYHYSYRDFIRETGERDVFHMLGTMNFLNGKLYVDYGNGFELKADQPGVYITGSGSFFIRFRVESMQRIAKSLRLELANSRYKYISIESCVLNGKSVKVVPENSFSTNGAYDTFITMCPQYSIDCDEKGEILLTVSGKVDLSVILTYDEILSKFSRELDEKQNELDEKQNELNNKNHEIEIKNHEFDVQSRALRLKTEELAARSRELETKNLKLEEQSREIEARGRAIISQDEELRAIKSSRGWRLLQKLWAVRDKFVPLGSKRRLVAKLAYKSIRSPRVALSKLSISNIKKLIHYMKTEDAASIEGRIDLHMPSSFAPGAELVLIDSVGDTEKKLSDYEKMEFPSFNEVTVSIVIPVYNQFNFTYNCLKSILNNTKGVSYEILIADDCSTDNTREMEKLFTGIVVIHNEKNLGFLRNCNHAASMALGKYILFLNNDTQVQPDWLPPLVDLMEEHDDIGMTGSKLVYPNGQLQEAGGIYWKDGSAWNYGHAGNPNDPEFNYVKDVDYISGASILIRRTLWEKIGGFDELFVPAYCEDSDLAFAVRDEGYRVVYQPKSVVVHFEGISNGTDVSTGIKKYQVENQKKLCEKWKEVLESEHFPNGEEVFLARDRSRFKKTIVVVDHYVPHYDTDAGGRCTFEYLKLFVELNMHVVFVGDNYAPHQPYTDELRQMGVNVLAGECWTIQRFRKWLDENGKYVDYVYLNRPHISVKYIDMFKEMTKAKIFYFGHDLHFIRERRQAEIENRPELLESAEKWEKVECGLFTKADVVHVVGAYEQGVLQEMFPGKPIRNIPLYLYEEGEMQSVGANGIEGRSTMIFVGGFNHQPNQDAVFWFMDEIYPKIIAEIPDLMFYIVGSRPTEKVKALANDKVVVTGYVSDEELEKLYSKARVNVIPLRYGAGVKGKVVETLAFGVPAVTTPIGAEGLPDVERCLDVVEEPEEYAARVLRYLRDDDYWVEHAKLGQQYIQEHFTKTHAKDILLKDMK